MANQGEIWAKLDAGTEAFYREICRSQVPFQRILDNLLATARRWPILIQTLFLSWKGQGPSADEVEAYCGRLEAILAQGGRLQALQLYTVARPTPEPEARPLSRPDMDELAARVRRPAARPAGGGLLRAGGLGLMRRRAGIAVIVAVVLGAMLGLSLACRPRRVPPPPPPPRLRLVAVGDILMHQDVKAAAEQAASGFPALWADLVPSSRGRMWPSATWRRRWRRPRAAPGCRSSSTRRRPCRPPCGPAGSRCSPRPTTTPSTRGPRGCGRPWTACGRSSWWPWAAARTGARAEALQVLERQGLKVAFLGFTDLFNVDLNRKATEPWVRPLDLEPALAAVREARSQADLVVVSVHWGNEYQRQPTQRQREIAKRLVEAGCDLILGHHPHVLQPAEIVEAGGRKALVAYSLGNFISNQDRMYRADLFPVAGGDSRDGAALQAVFEQRSGRGRTATKVALAETSFEPLWTENNWGSPAAQREIRVIRVAAAEARVRGGGGGPVDLPGRAGAPGHRTALLEKQEYLRTLILRRRRIAETLGEAFVRQELGQAQFRPVLMQHGDDTGEVLVLGAAHGLHEHAEALGHLEAVHPGGEGLVLELLLHALRFQALGAGGPHQGAGHDEAR